MQLDTYQARAKETASYPEHARVIYTLLGLIGEAGELAQKVGDLIWNVETPAQGKEIPLACIIGPAVTAGLMAEEVKKTMRGDKVKVFEPELLGAISSRIQKNMKEDPVVLAEIEKELGDVLWYISQLAEDLQLTLGRVAQTNLDKLASRKERGVIKGSGDNR